MCGGLFCAHIITGIIYKILKDFKLKERRKMFDLLKKSRGLSAEQIAELLKTNPALVHKMEGAYQESILHERKTNFFEMNSREASRASLNAETSALLDEIIEKISGDLLSSQKQIPDKSRTFVRGEDLMPIPEGLRPQLTRNMAVRDIGQFASGIILEMYKKWLETGDKNYYYLFRQGLDLQDLDPLMYEIIGMNKNSIGYWFPELEKAVEKQSFFKTPKTKSVKVPLPILQMTRLDYFSLTPTTKQIVNNWAMKAFDLDVTKKYFIKTGVYSSKFDFRNCKVASEEEVREIGEYLLYIQFQANQMGAPLSRPCIVGVSTTNEWTVREYIEDKENNPCIYHGMPLHTEYRVFVDFDAKEVLGVFPYWDPDVMKERFSKMEDKDTPDMKHDYITYLYHEKTLMERYEKNKGKVLSGIQSLIFDVDLKGQWSIDIMKNGDDFWLIDMALAGSSAFAERLGDKIKKEPENWLPDLSLKGETIMFYLRSRKRFLIP